jgi:hypothetical protein
LRIAAVASDWLWARPSMSVTLLPR